MQHGPVQYLGQVFLSHVVHSTETSRAWSFKPKSLQSVRLPPLVSAHRVYLRLNPGLQSPLQELHSDHCMSQGFVLHGISCMPSPTQSLGLTPCITINNNSLSFKVILEKYSYKFQKHITDGSGFVHVLNLFLVPPPHWTGILIPRAFSLTQSVSTLNQGDQLPWKVSGMFAPTSPKDTAPKIKAANVLFTISQLIKLAFIKSYLNNNNKMHLTVGPPYYGCRHRITINTFSL